MANCKRFKVFTVGDKFQVRQFGGMGIWQPRGELYDTRKAANTNIEERLAEFGATRSMGRAWST